VTELINHLDAEGKLFGPDRRWRPPVPRDEWPIPESLHAVIRRRLSSLDEATRRVLTMAAAEGKDFSYDSLEAQADIPSEELLEGLDEGIRIGMIEEVEGTAAGFRFTQQLTRRALLYPVSENRPRR
jgi:predicted ATPase